MPSISSHAIACCFVCFVSSRFFYSTSVLLLCVFEPTGDFVPSVWRAKKKAANKKKRSIDRFVCIESTGKAMRICWCHCRCKLHWFISDAVLSLKIGASSQLQSLAEIYELFDLRCVLLHQPLKNTKPFKCRQIEWKTHDNHTKTPLFSFGTLEIANDWCDWLKLNWKTSTDDTKKYDVDNIFQKIKSFFLSAVVLTTICLASETSAWRKTCFPIR